MSRTRSFLALSAVGLLVLAGRLAAQDEKKESAKAPATVEAKAETFTITVELKGTLGPDRVKTIAVEPKEWSSLKVVELADQGQMVKKGDVVLELDTDDIDQQIRSLEFSVKLAQLTLDQTEKELALLEKTAPMDLEVAERTRNQAKEDLAYYFEIEKPQQKESNRRSVESAEFQAEYANEELSQLKKMYEADDLTEETEEMILKRTERQAENAEYYLGLARIRAKRLLETTLPREEVEKKESVVRADLAFRRAAVATPIAVEKKKIELTKMRYDLEQNLAKLEALRADRDLLLVKSPVDGIVYHGQWKDGVWTLASTVKSALKVGGTLPAKTPVMAIVAPRPLSVRTTLEEKDVALVARGAKGTATPTAFPDREIPCQVTEVSSYPIEPGKFATSLALAPPRSQGLVPGMTVAIELTAYEKEDAITVPSKAVFAEDGEDVVYVANGDEATRRVVKKGRSHGDKTEILDGLEAGEKVRTSKP